MWHLSYGRMAEQLLESARADAAREALAAQAPRAGADRPVRQAVGQLLIRIGARLVMPSAPSTVR